MDRKTKGARDRKMVGWTSGLMDSEMDRYTDRGTDGELDREKKIMDGKADRQSGYG
jgi:hypothetical protein